MMQHAQDTSQHFNRDTFGQDGINIAHERLIRLSDVPRLKTLPRGHRQRRMHVSVVYRWAKRGLRGERLETIRVGGSLCTSREALQRFFNRLSGSPSPVLPEPPASRRRQIAEAAARTEAVLGTASSHADA
ncbi:MAG: DUF1580 domain-containing protein [Planctomycetota bacterium]|nr:DUF1580 domain-containing protein [Planctomycetota bacterium]